MHATQAISSKADTGLHQQQREGPPPQLYKGHVIAVYEDGSIDVVVDRQVHHAQARHPVQPGDLLSLRLAGGSPDSGFSMVGVLRRADLQRQVDVQVRAGWPEAISLLRQQEPGIETLLALWQRYPRQLAQLSANLPPLLGALQARLLTRDDLLDRGRLKAHGSSSWGLGEAPDTQPQPLIPLLARLLGQLQPTRQLHLELGQPVLGEREDAAARSLQPLVAHYRAEQEADSNAPQLRQLLTLNVEQALLGLVGSQLQTLERNGPNLSIWIMQLLLQNGEHTLPIDLFCQQQVQGREERWQLDFSVELPRSGRVEVTLLVKLPAVALRLRSSSALLCAHWRTQQDSLRKTLHGMALRLEEFVCEEIRSSSVELTA